MTTQRKLAIGLGAPAGMLALSCCVIEPLMGPLVNPLRRSNAGVAAWLLKQTPLGTNKAHVEQFVNSRGWGYGRDGSEPPGSISVHLGGYTEGFIFDIGVFAVWEFDENDRLRGVRVYKFWSNAL